MRVDTAARRGPRGPYAKSELTRSAILDAALEVFAASGYRAGSLRSVADRVGMSEAGLLHHFANKSALLTAVLERRDEQTRDQFDLAQVTGVDLLRSLVRLAEYNASTPGVVELFCTLAAEATSPEHPAHAYFQNRYAVAQGNFEKAFADVASRGELRTGVSPGAAARGVIALMDGLQIQWLLDRDAVDMAADLHAHIAGLVTSEF